MTTVDTYADEYTAREQAKRAVVEQVKYSLDDLIPPSDVEDGAETWDDIDEETLRMEVGESLDHLVSEGALPAIDDLAIVLWRESLPRVPMDDLVFSDRATAVREGYWPYKMNRTEVTELLWEFADEYEWFHEYQDEAEMQLHDAMVDAMHPLREPDV